MSEGILSKVRASVWAPLAGKAALALGGFVALAFVGSGAAAELLPTPVGGYLGPPPSAASQSAQSAASATPPPVEPAAADAGADAAPGADASAKSAAGAAVTPDGKVILNLAAEEDLRKLPGIGATRARAILAQREKLGGRFKRVEDLLRVKGIGRRSLAKLRPKLLIDPPP